MNNQTHDSFCDQSRLPPVFQRVLLPFVLAILLAITLPSAADDFIDAKRSFDAEEYSKAVHLLRPLAERGDPRAQHLLGFAYILGKGVKISDKQAAFWLRKAVAQDYTPAYALYGGLLMRIDRSPARGLPLIKIGVHRGDPQAQASLGMLYFMGRPGVPVNMAESKRLLLLAAGQRHKGGYLGLAIWHASDKGKKPDFVELLKWIVIDTRIGTGAADLYRSRALKHLNQAQVAEANHRAAAWLKAHGETP